LEHVDRPHSHNLLLAGDGLFGWIYTLDLQPKGKWEFEQRLQLNKQQAAGTYDSWFSRSEIEYGLTNDLQVAGIFKLLLR
jgi:hypothetical protein